MVVSLATQDILDHLNLGGMSTNFLLGGRQDQCLFCVLGAALNAAKLIIALSHVTAFMSSFVFCSRCRKGTFVEGKLVKQYYLAECILSLPLIIINEAVLVFGLFLNSFHVNTSHTRLGFIAPSLIEYRRHFPLNSMSSFFFKKTIYFY